MAQTPQALLASLKELQSAIPGIESSVARLQALLKAGFGGSEASLSAVNIQLQNITRNAETAIASMSDVSRAQAAQNALQSALKETGRQLDLLQSKARSGTTAAPLDLPAPQQPLMLAAPQQPLLLPAAGQTSGSTKPIRLPGSLESGPEIVLPESASRDYYQKVKAEAEAAAQVQIDAMDRVIMKMREMYGNRAFTENAFNRNMTTAAGGNKAFASTFGMNQQDQFDLMQSSGQIKRLPTGKFQFTTTTPQDARAEQERLKLIDEMVEHLVSLGAAYEDARKHAEAYYQGGTGKRLPNQPPAQPKPTTEEDLRKTLLEGGGLDKFFGNPQRLEQFKSRINDLGISLTDLKRASTDVASGITTMSFEGVDKNLGMMRNATVYVDEFGRVVTHNTSKVKSFNDIITQNIDKVLMWAVALGVVYGSMQKIGELVESMKKIQEAMTDISITSKASADGLELVYQEVLKISQATATDLSGGLTSFNQALRATGSMKDEPARVAMSLKLLTDSLTLAKLAGLDTKRAMDLLIAGLKQLNMPMDAGGALLNKFQGIANQANSSLEDMATTFAITAGAADDVGVKVNDLVALIGAFSEATSLSATETGNALRAMFSNFTQPAAIATLTKYGIAVQDVNGEFKSFIDVFQQASALARSGVLNDRQVSEIANALGGGSRRQAQVTALLTVAPRQTELKDFLDQGKDAGSVQDALAQKTGTLTAALEKMQNSFDNLGKTLGTEGGFLDALTSMVNLLTKVIDLASQLTKALGPGLPLLLGGVALTSVLKGQGPVLGKYGGMLAGAIGSPVGGLMGAGSTVANTVSYQMGDNGKNLGQALTNSTMWAGVGTTLGKNALNSLLPIIPLFAGKFMESTQTGDWSETAGMGLGAAFMGMISGSAVWAMVGALIGQAIMKTIQDNAKVAAAGEKAKATPLPEVPAVGAPQEIYKQTEALRTQLENLQGADVNTERKMSLFRFGTDSGAKILPMLAERYKELEKTMSPEEAFSKLQNQRFVYSKEKNFLGQDVEKSFTGTQGFSQETLQKFSDGTSRLNQFLEVLTNSNILGQGMTPDQQVLLNNKAFVTAKTAFMGTPQDIASASAQGDLIGTPEYKYNRQKRYEFAEQLTKGEINPGDYKQRVSSLSSSGLIATNVLTSLNKDINPENVKKYEEEWLRLKDVITLADEGTQTYLSQAATDLNTAKEKLDDLLKKQEQVNRGWATTSMQGFENLPERIQDTATEVEILTNQMNGLVDAAEAAGKAAEFAFKGFSDYSKYSASELDAFVQQARGLQEIYAKQTNTDLQELIKNAPDFVTMDKDSFKTREGLNQQFLDTVLQQYDEFKTQMEEKMKFNFKSLRNLPVEMAQKLQQAMNYYTNLLKQYGFNDKNEAITVLFKDNQVGQLVGSQTALQLALEDLTEVEKKKLDGVYNLPSGATAYIPLQAGQLLSEYTNNTTPTSNVNYGATPAAPPAVGSYPLGQASGGITFEQYLKMKEQEMTPLQKQAERIGNIKYAGWSPEGYKEENRPYWEKYSMDKMNGQSPPPTMSKEMDANFKGMDMLGNIIKQLYGSFAPFLKILAGSAVGSMLPNTLSGAAGGANGAANAGQTLRINIQPEKQTIETTVSMNINLDSRRLWEGMKKVAMADYARLTASVGDSQRSRGNVV
jgi:TP901 family phage tail tape measure protein